MNKILTYQQGFSFPIPVITISVIFSIVSIITAITHSPLSLFVLVVCSLIWTSVYGTEINSDKKLYREYGAVLGFKYGKWNSLDEYPYITVLKDNFGYKVYSRTNQSNTISFEYYNVCLLSKSHRKNIVIKKFDTKHNAFKFVSELCKLTNKEFQEFNPAVSEKTKKARRK